MQPKESTGANYKYWYNQLAGTILTAIELAKVEKLRLTGELQVKRRTEEEPFWNKRIDELSSAQRSLERQYTLIIEEMQRLLEC